MAEGRHGLPAPRTGYRWVQDDSGNWIEEYIGPATSTGDTNRGYVNPAIASTEAKRAKVRESGSSRFWHEREAALPNVENYQQQREAARAAAETAWPRHRAKVRYNEWGHKNGWGLGRKI